MNATPEQIAWAAGLFEGEGCINVYQRDATSKVQGQIRLGMTDRDVVERFAAIVGVGNIHLREYDSEERATWKPCHVWVVYEASKVREVIRMFLPYFGERRAAKAEEVLYAIRNVQAQGAAKSHCPHGHAIEGDNLYEERVSRDGREYVARRCKTCRVAQAKARAAKRLEGQSYA